MRFTLNGKEMQFNGDTGQSLLEYLKRVGKLSITDAGCDGTGRCGACTVQLDDQAVLACATTMEKVADRAVITTDISGQLIQNAFSSSLMKTAPTECSYCIPEMVMKARVFLENNPEPLYENALRVVGHNLCRCVGRSKVARAMLGAAEVLKKNGKENCLE